MSDGDEEAARPNEATMLVQDTEPIVASAPRDRGDEEADRNRRARSTTKSMRWVGAVAFALLGVGTVAVLFRRHRPEE